MSLRHGLLGLLNYGPMTGYELSKAFHESLYFFWNAQTSQIYRELTAMESKEWLTSSIYIQTDKPNKKIYAITESGKTELMNWLVGANFSNDFKLQNSFLLRLFFSGERNINENIEMLKTYKQKCEEALDEIALSYDYANYYKEMVPNPEETSIYWNLCSLYGKKNLKMAIEFADDAMDALKVLL